MENNRSSFEIVLVPMKPQDLCTHKQDTIKTPHGYRYGLLLLIGLAFSANLGALIGFWITGGKGMVMGGMPLLWLFGVVAEWTKTKYNDAVRAYVCVCEREIVFVFVFVCMYACVMDKNEV